MATLWRGIVGPALTIYVDSRFSVGSSDSSISENSALAARGGGRNGNSDVEKDRSQQSVASRATETEGVEAIVAS